MKQYRYTPRGTTWDACPGCGEEENRPRNRVCDRCKIVLDLDKARKASTAAMETTTAEKIVVRAQEKAYALPFLRYGDQRELADVVKQGFFQLSMDLSSPAKYCGEVPDLWPFGKAMHRSWGVEREMPSHFANTLRDTYSAIMVLLDSVYADGHADGRNLLNQLAAGHITSDEFNDTSTRRET